MDEPDRTSGKFLPPPGLVTNPQDSMSILNGVFSNLGFGEDPASRQSSTISGNEPLQMPVPLQARSMGGNMLGYLNGNDDYSSFTISDQDFLRPPSATNHFSLNSFQTNGSDLSQANPIFGSPSFSNLLPNPNELDSIPSLSLLEPLAFGSSLLSVPGLTDNRSSKQSLVLGLELDSSSSSSNSSSILGGSNNTSSASLPPSQPSNSSFSDISLSLPVDAQLNPSSAAWVPPSYLQHGVSGNASSGAPSMRLSSSSSALSSLNSYGVASLQRNYGGFEDSVFGASPMTSDSDPIMRGKLSGNGLMYGNNYPMQGGHSGMPRGQPFQSHHHHQQQQQHRGNRPQTTPPSLEAFRDTIPASAFSGNSYNPGIGAVGGGAPVVGYSKTSPNPQSSALSTGASGADGPGTVTNSGTGGSGSSGMPVEEVVTSTCRDILAEAANHSLKAVELANTLRARVGTDVLAQVRDRWGGLLSLLEKLPGIFRVERIPKNDLVSLVPRGPMPPDFNILNELTAEPPMAPGYFGAGGTAGPTGGNTRSRIGNGMPASQGTSEQMQFYGSGGNPQPRGYGSDGPQKQSRYGQQQQGPQHTLPQQQQPRTHGPGVGKYGPQGQYGGPHATAAPMQQQQLTATSGPTRCLHIGNVPVHYTEQQLGMEFSQFGEIEGIKMINQRIRRFAFITFRRIASAIAAKQSLSKVASWKNAISFAHKESYAGYIGAPGAAGATSAYEEPKPADYRHATTQGSASHAQSTAPTGHAPAFSSESNLLQMLGGDNASVFEDGVLPNSNQESMLANLGLSLGLGPASGSGSGGGSAERGPQSISPAPTYLTLYGTGQSGSIQRAVRSSSPGQAAPIDPVLRRLCDDTYVPTQIWPIDLVADSPYTTAVIQQLRQFGGTITISKLRGFLRNRLNATDNIKSVPLKALLAAYPHLFYVNGTQVSLLLPPGSSQSPGPGASPSLPQSGGSAGGHYSQTSQPQHHGHHTSGHSHGHHHNMHGHHGGFQHHSQTQQHSHHHQQQQQQQQQQMQQQMMFGYGGGQVGDSGHYYPPSHM